MARQKPLGLWKLALAGLLAGIGALAYRGLLTKEARESIKDLRATFSDSKEIIRDKVEEIRGQIMEEDESADNRVRTRRQWEELGY